MLFPNTGPNFNSNEHRGVVAMMERSYVDSITINQTFWSEADIDTRFMEGDQSLWQELYGNVAQGQYNNFFFNRIRRTVNLVGGYQRQHRKSIIATPIENADQETADQFTKILMWIVNQGQMLETLSESFHGALVTGLNLLHIWVDYRADPISGRIILDNCAYNTFILDPYFKKSDLSDCNYIWKRSFLTKREIMSLLPADAEDVLAISPKSDSTKRDPKFQYMPETYDSGQNNLLSYDEFYYRDYRTQKLLVDTQTGESWEWPGSDGEELEEFLLRFPEIEIIKNEIPTVRLAITVQGKVMYDGPNPLGIDDYPFVPVFGYFNPQMSQFPYRIQGMVRGLRSSQFLFNRRRIIELDILESQINSGWIYKENALVNPNDVFLAGQGKGLAIKQEANIADVIKIPPATLDANAMELTIKLGAEIAEISGVNEEMVGSAVDDKAAILAMHRTEGGKVTLQILYDQFDRAQKKVGDIFIAIIQSNFVPGKIKKILGGEEPAPQFYNKAFGKYGAIVEEGLNTSTQRQMQFAQMVQLHELGVPISAEDLLEASTIQNKKTIVDNAAKQEQKAQELQQAQAQAEMQEQQARVELAHARANADIGLAVERTSRVEENRALAIERLAEANKDDEMATLNKVKAMKELEEMDLGHLEKLITLSQMLKDDQHQVAQEQ